VTNTWSPLTDINAPEARSGHAAVWIGTQMVIWGGFNLQETIFLNGGIWTP